jgi:hypothetical protein
MRRLVVAVVLVLGWVAVAVAEPPHTHEYLTERPSGFWTSNAPAVNGAYKYHLMEVGLVVLAITGFLTFRLVRRVSAQRGRS